MLLLLFFALHSLADAQSPGGDLTHEEFTHNAFTLMGPNVTGETKMFFAVGNSLFNTNWVSAPGSVSDRDGLGPTYNAVSCSSCHTLDGRGRGYTENSLVHLSLLFRLSHADNYGGQLNPLAIDGVPAEAKASVFFETVHGTYADGTPYELRAPHFEFSDFAFGPFDSKTQISPRVAPQMIGLGLIEAIREEDLRHQADPFDLDGDGISGVANEMIEVGSGKLKIGRFGWKANQPSLKQQNAAAFSGDIGLTSTLFPNVNCPPAQLLCLQAINGGDPEVVDKAILRVTTYTQTIGVPGRRNATSPNVQNGEMLFKKIRCDSCHTPSYTTGSNHEVSFLNNQQIYPYSDFLLHDMGEGLADHREDEKASGTEWRTAPLWGIGLVPMVNKHQNLLHDARARGVEEAILWHGGEAESVRENFKKLTASQRSDVIDFVNSL